MIQRKLSILNDIEDTAKRALLLISEIRRMEKSIEQMRIEVKLCEERLCYDMLQLGRGSMEYAGIEQIINISEFEIGRRAGRYAVRRLENDKC